MPHICLGDVETGKLPEKNAPSSDGKLNISGLGKKSHLTLCGNMDSEEWSKGEDVKEYEEKWNGLWKLKR